MTANERRPQTAAEHHSYHQATAAIHQPSNSSDCSDDEVLVSKDRGKPRKNQPVFVFNEARERSEAFFPWFSKETKSLFITGRTSIGCQKQKTKHYSRCMCVMQHRNWPLRSTILNAHGTNASPDGLCTRTHTNEAFSCWFCCKSFKVDRARRGNVCL